MKDNPASKNHLRNISHETEIQTSLSLSADLNSSPEQVRPRGTRVMLPHGGLPEVVSLYMLKLIQETGGEFGPLGRQFIARPELEKKFYQKKLLDPLIEDAHEVAPGLVYKYQGKIKDPASDKKDAGSDYGVEYFGRALWTVTRFCATYCRFCTRGREVGLPPMIKAATSGAIAQQPFLRDEQIEEVFTFIKSHPELNEIIVSGGDPLTAPQAYLTKIITGLANLQKEGQLEIVRIGTRLPIHNPASIQDWHYELLGKLKNPYLMIHINHPLELTNSALEVLGKFRRISGATIMSQSVLLKGINDRVEILHNLFVKMAKEGIRPYYVYQNDPVYWAAHFTVPIKRAIKIWGELRPKLSGVAATARLVIDTPLGYGKVALPEGDAWEVNYRSFKDFKNHKFSLE